MQSRRVRMDSEEAEETEFQELGSVGAGFFVKKSQCDTIDVIEDTKLDESILLRVPGEW